MKKFNIESYCILYRSKHNETSLESLQTAINSLDWHSNDLVGESCSNIESRFFWIVGFHSGPLADIPSTLIHLGQNPKLTSFNAHYANAFSSSHVTLSFSQFIKNYNNISKLEINELEIAENFEYFRNSPDFKNVSGVICSFPSSMCEAFIALNKTIIFNPAHR